MPSWPLRSSWHEVSHGLIARTLGDDTAAKAGRLSLNPIRHIDPFGTILLPALLALTAPFVFGWAKPVPVDTAKLRDPRNHAVAVALAGPAANIALALLAALAFRIIQPTGQSVVWDVIVFFGVVNVVLAVFNLLPIPPLDGAALVEWALPARWLDQYRTLRNYSLVLVFALLLLARGPLTDLFSWAVRWWVRLL